jgi:hypothetical protein
LFALALIVGEAVGEGVAMTFAFVVAAFVLAVLGDSATHPAPTIDPDKAATAITALKNSFIPNNSLSDLERENDSDAAPSLVGRAQVVALHRREFTTLQNPCVRSKLYSNTASLRFAASFQRRPSASPHDLHH